MIKLSHSTGERALTPCDYSGGSHGRDELDITRTMFNAYLKMLADALRVQVL